MERRSKGVERIMILKKSWKRNGLCSDEGKGEAF